jgi:HSP20 family protein
MQLIRRSNSPIPTFSRLLDSFLTDEFFMNQGKGASLWNNTMPAVNIKETEDQYELEVAAPGFDKADFQISVEQNVLTISSEKKNNREKNGEDGRITRCEFSYSAFKRSFDLPEMVNQANISANYNNGILSIVIPKKEEAKPQPARKIEIS